MFFDRTGHERFDYAVVCGIYAIPASQRDALRNLFARAAIGWFAEDLLLPFAPDRSERASNTAKSSYHHGEVSAAIIEALLHLRAHPADLFSWLADTKSPQAWTYLCRKIENPDIIDEPVYYAVDKQHEPALRAMTRALQRLAQDGLFAAVSPDTLQRAWEEVGMQNQPLYDKFRAADAVYSGAFVHLDKEERAACLESIRNVLNAQISL